MSDIFFQILGAIRKNDEKSGIADLDRTSQELLRVIADEHASGKMVHVGDLAQRRDIGSSPSIYLKLKLLSEGGWIETAADESDGRFRKVMPSKKAIKAFKVQTKTIEGLLARYS